MTFRINSANDIVVKKFQGLHVTRIGDKWRVSLGDVIEFTIDAPDVSVHDWFVDRIKGERDE